MPGVFLATERQGGGRFQTPYRGFPEFREAFRRLTGRSTPSAGLVSDAQITDASRSVMLGGSRTVYTETVRNAPDGTVGVPITPRRIA